MNADVKICPTAGYRGLSTEVLNDSVYNTRAYGAKGDGSTDDLSAIQSAVDDADSDGGGVVFFSQGTYLVADDTLEVQIQGGDNTKLKGAGKEATLIKLGDSVEADVIGNKEQDTANTANKNIEIEGLAVDGNKSNQPPMGAGISTSSPSRRSISRPASG